MLGWRNGSWRVSLRALHRPKLAGVPPRSPIVPFVTTILAAFAGAALFEFLRIPAGALLGATVAVTAVNLSPLAIAVLPRWTYFIVFASLGWMIGQGITSAVLRSLLQRAPLIVGLAAALLLFGGLLAFIAAKTGLLDPATALLATSPGGLSQMAALSAAVGADGAVVATIHTLRVVTVIFLIPAVLRFLPT